MTICDMNPDPESALVAAAARGDEQAFTALITRCDHDLRVFVAAHASNREQMEEACQATWVEAWTGLTNFRGDAPFASWLRGIARNQIRRDMVRQARSRARGGMTELAEAVAESVRLDSETTLVEARLHRLSACLDSLAPRARALLLARDRDGVPLGDMARRFKQPMGALATMLWRVRAAMRVCLDRAGP